ncbi:MAG: cytoskeleton protein RodZ [Azoarcus sp.]|uniref:Cytoskeleton protein RodZ n=1 Tax=Aromatoleum tolulyticum TaxID=34027 RepID=A0A1N6SWN5_9RHOO|nr:RodZ domain-containing protein [Aromatoleum tolulyticum]MCK9984810.1 cytoskeleton protein RodZ [Azoarcus sp.]SIQ45434.1 cytoskeleton protein RodZ [Aromatoleum tolulyticum]
MTEVHLDQHEAASSDPAAEMGAQLRQLREARGETASDVAHSLKLTSRQIEAMEAGRLDLLPGAAFARGFLRNYARYLGVDAATVLAAFEAEVAPRVVELAPVSNAVGVMPSGSGGRSVQIPVGLIAGALLLVVLVGWYFDWFRMPEENAEAEEHVVEPVAQAVPAVTSVAAAPQGQVSESALAASGVVPSLPAAAPATPAAPAPETAAAPAPAPPAPPSAALAPVPAAATAVPPAPAAEGIEHIVFRFEGESWIEVRDARGAIVYSGVNGAGSSRTVQGKPPFALVVGNARQVSLDYRGKPYDMKPHVRVSVARFTLE